MQNARSLINIDISMYHVKKDTFIYDRFYQKALIRKSSLNLFLCPMKEIYFRESLHDFWMIWITKCLGRKCSTSINKKQKSSHNTCCLKTVLNQIPLITEKSLIHEFKRCLFYFLAIRGSLQKSILTSHHPIMQLIW